MSKQTDRKLEHVPVAEFRYRHEAELAAGFLADAGIPFRLQADDAGGADLGLSLLRPSILWVRAVDQELARDLIAPVEDEPVRAPAASAVAPRRPSEPSVGSLSARERAVSGVSALALLVTAPNLPPSPLQTPLVVLCSVAGVAFLAAAALGRAPGLLGGLLRMLSGSDPR